MDELMIPGFSSLEDGLTALRHVSSEVALLALLRNAPSDGFLCIGRDRSGRAMLTHVSADAFLDWLDLVERRPSHLC